MLAVSVRGLLQIFIGASEGEDESLMRDSRDEVRTIVLVAVAVTVIHAQATPLHPTLHSHCSEWISRCKMKVLKVQTGQKKTRRKSKQVRLGTLTRFGWLRILWETERKNSYSMKMSGSSPQSGGHSERKRDDEFILCSWS